MMKVQCPECKAMYRVDEKKIPEEGIKVRCQKCQNQLFIKKEIEPITNFLADQEEKKDKDKKNIEI